MLELIKGDIDFFVTCASIITVGLLINLGFALPNVIHRINLPVTTVFF